MLAVYIHHQYIASLLTLGSLSHFCIFLVRDFTSSTSSSLFSSVVGRLLIHKSSLISHLSYVSLVLGFHTLGLYVHNDTVVSFGDSDKELLLDPIFSDLILDSSADRNSILQPRLPLSSGDLLAHHSISLGIHVTVLILLKASFDSNSSTNFFG
jgi:photosystem I P700 chlorophyll a apoprotein A2